MSKNIIYPSVACLLVLFSSLGHTQTVQVNRSLLVNDQATLTGADFSLTRVMNQLASQFNAINTAETITGEQLFARMWDAQNPVNTLPSHNVPQCNGIVGASRVTCRPIEGAQANNAAREIAQYRPIALVNRFDLRDKINFNDCGEYRIVYGKNRITGSPARNFIIFEAELPNPTRGDPAGCQPVQQIWADLSSQSDAGLRATALESFYFTGNASLGISKVIDVLNFNQDTGQIRTNQFMTAPWVLKEYKAVVSRGRSFFKVVTDKSNPIGTLFVPTNTTPNAQTFKNNFVNNLQSLTSNDLAAISLIVASDTHNNGQSHSSSPLAAENNFVAQTGIGASTFKTSIQTKLTNLNTRLTSAQLLGRATAMTCGGCHQPVQFNLLAANSLGNNITWPNSLGFVHVGEVAINGSFPLSPALRNIFLPARKTDMETFLATNAAQSQATARTSTLTSTATPTPADLPSEPTPGKIRIKRAG